VKKPSSLHLLTAPLPKHIAQHPEVVAALLVAHKSDHLGYCHGCYLPQTGPMRWPCTLWKVATIAASVRKSTDDDVLLLLNLIDARAENLITGPEVDERIVKMTKYLRSNGSITGDFFND
jgi:hypothetical protein